VRGRSHPMITSCGVRRLRGRLCRWTAAFAKASACWPDCLFPRASAIHSRMMARRTFGLAIWIPFRGADGNPPWSEDTRVVQLFRSPDGALRRLLDRIGLRSSRQKRATAFMHGAVHDNEAAFRHRGAKAFVRCWFLCVNPNHQHSARAEEIHQPVHRRLKRVKRASPPIHKRNVVLTGWTAAIARRCRQQISAPVQLQHQFHALRAGYHDALAR
jgi:hypothetical protein